MKLQPTKPSITARIASWVTILLSMAALPANATTVANIGGDYTGPTTLPADWSYFYSNLASGGTEVALTPNLALGNAGGFGFGTPGQSFNLPGVKDASTTMFGDGGANAGVLGTDLILHPGFDAAHSTVILRYTISAAKIAAYGTSASIAGSFRDLISGGDSIIVSVYHNTTQLFTKTGSGGTLTQANGTFNISDLTVAADDTISFVLNYNTNAGADESALRGTISLVAPTRPAASIYWTGDASSAWNTLATNWKLVSDNAPTEFQPNDEVLFHDNPTTPVVAISDGDVNPLATTFDNTSVTAYTLQGTNGIATGTLTKSGNGSLTITNTNSTSGEVALNDGLTSIASSGGLGSGAITFDGGTLEYTETAATATWGARDISLNTGGGSVNVTDSGSTLSTTGILSGVGLLTKLGAGTLVLGQTTSTVDASIAISGGTLDLNCGAGAVVYAGNLTGSGGNLQIAGSGSITLSGTNDYTGTTTVTQGTLVVSSGSGTGSGAVTVQTNATLAGSASISGSVSIEAGGFVAPGDAGIGTLTVASATLSGTYKCQLDATSADQVVVSGALTVDPGAAIAIAPIAIPSAASYTIATYGSLVGSLPVVTGIPSGYVLDTATAGEIKLAPVPANVANIAAITSPSTVPDGWSYLYSDLPSGGTEVALTPDLAIGNGGNSGFGKADRDWKLPGVIGTQAGPQFEIFTDGDLNAPALGSDLLIHPDGLAATANVILRYTVSAAAIAAHGNSASIAGSFRRLIANGDSVTVSIYHNATQLFAKSGSATTGTLTQANGTFGISGVTVAADDTISFVVNGNGNIASDETALRGTITLVVPTRPSTDIYWTGAASDAWNTLATNWKLVSNDAPTLFQPNDAVFFHDTLLAAEVIDISDGNVSPLATTFDNTTATAYTLQGTNGIATGAITKSGNGSLTITNSSSTLGAVALNGGLTSLTYGDGLGSGAITFDGGALEYTGTTANWGARNLTVNAGGGSVGVTESTTTLTTSGTLTGAGQLAKLGAGTLVLGQTTGTVSTPVALSGGTLTLNHGAGAVTYSGKFTGSGGDLRLAGSGSLTLSGPNDYTGSTTVTQGTLVVSSGSGTGSGALTVQTTATLAGTASISGSVSIEAGGFVAPGNAGIGTLTVASAALSGTYQCQLDATTADQVVVSGALTVNPGAVIAVGTLATPAAASYLIATYGSLVGSLPIVTGIPSGYMLDTATTGQIKLVPLPANVTIIADIAGDYTGPSTLPANWGYFYTDKTYGSTEVALTPDLPLGVATGGTNIGFGTPGQTLNMPGVLGTKVSGAEFEIWPDGDSNAPVLGTDLILHPGFDDAHSTVILRYTISAAKIASYGSSATITGSFRDLVYPGGGDSVIVSVYHNTTQLFTKTGSNGILTEANGAFNISGLAVAANDTISFVLNYNTNAGADETALRGSIALVQSTGGYSTWADSWTAPALSDKTPGGDSDHDGISNVMEYVIGGDPRVSSTSYLPSQAIVGTDLVLSYERSDASETDTTQTGQWSTNLTDWNDLAPVLVSENAADPDSMEIRIPLSNAVGGKLFGRLHVTQP